MPHEQPNYETCKVCRFWTAFRGRNGEGGYGECRIRAPRVVRDEGVAVTHWPSTHRDDWCGQYSACARPAPSLAASVEEKA